MDDTDPDCDAPDVALLSRRSSSAGPSTRPQPQERLRRGESKMTSKGTLRAYWLGSVLCVGGFLFGYDSGIIGGVLTLTSFEKDFRYSTHDSTRNTSLANSLQQLGAFLSCFIIWPITRNLGRKWAIIGSSFVFCIGALVQTINTHSFSTFLAFRFISGLGLGASSVVVPMFNSEMVPKHIRGQIGSFYQLFYTLGIFTSYWIDYGVKLDITSGHSSQWQIPVGVQLVPGALLGLGMLTIPESVRWLTMKGRHEEAWKSLTWIRADSGPETEREMDEIRQGVEIERQAKEGFTLKELVTNRFNLKRVLTAAAVFTAQQATGATAFAYYGPQYFKLLVGSSGNRDLLLTAIFGAIKVAACLTFVLFVAERVNRKSILIAGAAIMAACMISTAAVVATHPAPSSKDPHVTHSGIATIALIYLFVIAYNFSWGPLPWPYVSEIFPTRIREPGIGVGVATQWLFNFVFSVATPYMIAGIGWGTFLFWGICDLLIALGVWFLLKETRGLSLEEIAETKGDSTTKLHEEYSTGLDYHDSHNSTYKKPSVDAQ